MEEKVKDIVKRLRKRERGGQRQTGWSEESMTTSQGWSGLQLTRQSRRDVLRRGDDWNSEDG